MSTHFPLLSAELLKIQRGEGNEAKLILNGDCDCTFVIESGQFYHLVGPSGVGKSSLLWAVARLHALLAGRLALKGESFSAVPIDRWRAEVALLPQQPAIIPGTIEDNLLYPLQQFKIQKTRLNERAESLPTADILLKELESVGLDSIPLERQAISLSGGQQARLALIRVLLTRPQLILADEPTAGVDEMATVKVFERLQQFCDQGGAVMFTTHLKHPIKAQQIELNGEGGLNTQ
jgi:putative ABC transport system ATP-binding protein